MTTASNDIRSYTADILDCFSEHSIQEFWYGGTKGKVGDRPNTFLVAINEDLADWYDNCYVLKNSIFNYKAFRKIPVQIDCQSAGVYVFFLNAKQDDK